jgi:hypothetical protein
LKAKHEIDGYGPPGEKGETKIKMLEGAIKQIKGKIKAKQEKQAKKANQAKQGKKAKKRSN